MGCPALFYVSFRQHFRPLDAGVAGFHRREGSEGVPPSSTPGFGTGVRWCAASTPAGLLTDVPGDQVEHFHRALVLQEVVGHAQDFPPREGPGARQSDHSLEMAAIRTRTSPPSAKGPGVCT
jgi:hypothetical protein